MVGRQGAVFTLAVHCLDDRIAPWAGVCPVIGAGQHVDVFPKADWAIWVQRCQQSKLLGSQVRIIRHFGLGRACHLMRFLR